MAITFVCPKCGTSFKVPKERLPTSSARGSCKQCGVSLAIYPGGRISMVNVPSAPKSPPAAGKEPGWEFERPGVKGAFDRGPFTIQEVRERIFSEEIMESDLARVAGSEWAPARAYPILSTLFAEYLKALKERFGDRGHCGNHKDSLPICQCLHCGTYLCEECVKNEPVIEGGANRLICGLCEGETRMLPKRRIQRLLGGAKKR